MAQLSEDKYSRKCPDCNGDLIIGWQENKESLFGIIGVPPSPIGCKRCKMSGRQYPKKVILHIDKIEPEIFYEPKS